MTRRDVLRLGAVGTGLFATGGLTRVAGRATAQSRAVPTVDRLVMTNVVDNIYDVFAKGGKLDSITVERAGLRFGADALLAEHGLAYHLESVRGSERRQILLDFTSCGHAGVINSVRQVQKATGIDKVHAVVGGFHLAPAPDEIVAKTVEAFKTINPDYIIPMHCTGLNTIIAVHGAMPRKLVMPSAGTRVIFGA